MLKTPFSKVNETQVFQQAVKSLGARAPAEMNQIFQQFDAEKKKKMREILQSAQIDVVDGKGGVEQVQRRIVRVVKRGGGAQDGARRLELPVQPNQ